MIPGYQGVRRDRRDGPPRLRTDHDFYKQLKFKTSANGQIGEEDVKRIFGVAGKVTKGSFWADGSKGRLSSFSSAFNKIVWLSSEALSDVPLTKDTVARYWRIYRLNYCENANDRKKFGACILDEQIEILTVRMTLSLGWSKDGTFRVMKAISNAPN